MEGCILCILVLIYLQCTMNRVVFFIILAGIYSSLLEG